MPIIFVLGQSAGHFYEMAATPEEIRKSRRVEHKQQSMFYRGSPYLKGNHADQINRLG